MYGPYPVPTTSIIYFLHRKERIVYVGQCINGMDRLKDHITQRGRTKKVFDAYSYIMCRSEDLDKLEEYYIRTLKPEYNKILPDHRTVPWNVSLIRDGQKVFPFDPRRHYR